MSKNEIAALQVAGFPLFVVIWNQMQGVGTPKFHLEMAQWLEQAWEQKKTRLLLMAFRGAGKSSMVGLFAAWLLYRNADLRLLVLAADFNLAKKMVRNVKRIIERHPFTKGLRPDNPDQWASDRFTIRREMVSRDPSMQARGVSSNITGTHADIVICDDVEVPNTCDSAEKRENLRERLAEIPYVLVAGGTQLYVGTPHDYYSIYADREREEIGEEFPFLDGFERLSVPLLDENGVCPWPEKYPPEEIEKIKKHTGPNKFDQQMMLREVNILESRLNVDLLQYYTGEIEYCILTNDLYIGHQKMVGACAWWDPAFGRATGDSSVLAIVYTDQGGNYYLHHIEYIKIDENVEEDEAKQQCRIVAHLAKKHYLPGVVVETNGIGQYLPRMLMNVMKEEKVLQTSVTGTIATKPKTLRILESFDVILAAQRLWVNKTVRETPFIREMREWRPGKAKCRDDGLDAVAGAISREPDRMEGGYRQGGQSWHKSAQPGKAKSDFEV
ncbi:MAG: phage terminase large subunit [Alphaproteobacteria bacterium]|nr:phage terminase large subunit [Alphaproteobacteria bacterium]